MRKQLLLLAGAACLSLAAQAQCGSFGTGVDGAFNATVTTTLAGGTYNYTSFNINPGIIVVVTGNQPLIINCTGPVTIDGMLRADGQNGTNGITYTSGGTGGAGVAGGGNGGNGTFSSSLGPLPGVAGTGPGSTNNQGGGWSGGGGAGYATTGDSSGSSSGGFGGPGYGTVQITATDAGSGGGGGSGGYDCGAGGGGGGGGYIAIHAPSITIGAAGAISVNGGNGGSDGTGNCGGGGGGSGGSIWLEAPTVTFNGIMTAVGGTGGASAVPGSPYYGTGANGADGRIRVDHNGPLAGTGTASPAIGYTTTVASVTAQMATTNVNCFGDSTGTAVVTVMGGASPYTYVWTPSGPNASTQTGLGAGNYSCLVTDQNGCTGTATGTITQPSQLQLTASVMNPSCFGTCDGSIIATAFGGTPGYTYLWSPMGAITPNISNLCAGCYTLTVTDANACTTVTVICITEPPQILQPGFLGADTLICDSATVSLCAPSGFTAYMWSTSSTAMCINADSTGCYSIVITDNNGCQAADTICVTETPCMGIQEISGDAEMIFPNPSTGVIRIHHGEPGMQLVEVHDTYGKLCASKMLADDAELDLSGLAEGIYTISVNGTQHRLVITR